MDQLIWITEKGKAAEDMRGCSDKGEIEADQAKAGEARKRARERVGQTLRRWSSEGGDEGSSKWRVSGSNTLAFLRES